MLRRFKFLDWNLYYHTDYSFFWQQTYRACPSDDTRVVFLAFVVQIVNSVVISISFV